MTYRQPCAMFCRHCGASVSDCTCLDGLEQGTTDQPVVPEQLSFNFDDFKTVGEALEDLAVQGDPVDLGISPQFAQKELTRAVHASPEATMGKCYVCGCTRPVAPLPSGAEVCRSCLDQHFD